MPKLGKQFPSAILFIIFFIPSLLLNIYLLTSKSKPNFVPGQKVISVYDGDTFIIDTKARVRLRHADAPELEYCGGSEAKAYLKKLISGKTVIIQEIVPDQYGRGMGLVYMDGDLINKLMLESGWAKYHSDSSSVEEELKAVAADAKKQGRGLYGLCQSLENTVNPKCNIKGNIDGNNSSKKTYYLPNCAQYKFTVVEKDIGEDYFCTEKEAQKAGFVKASTCRE